MSASYEGGCHCGVIQWTFSSQRPPSQWTVRACQCSFCRAHGARCTSDPQGSVTFHFRDNAATLRYRFGVKSADFLVCGKCGVYVGAVIESSTGAFTTLNLNAMKTPVPGLREATPVSYDSESRDDRIARRLSKWTPATIAI